MTINKLHIDTIRFLCKKVADEDKQVVEQLYLEALSCIRGEKKNPFQAEKQIEAVVELTAFKTKTSTGIVEGKKSTALDLKSSLYVTLTQLEGVSEPNLIVGKLLLLENKISNQSNFKIW